jgi:hypothetical protein
MRFFVFLMLFTSPAFAGFLETKSRWDDVSEQGKHGYVMGYFDGFSSKVLNDDDMNAYKEDLENCVSELGLLAPDFIEIIEKGYEDLENWSKRPSSLLLDGLRSVCLDKMNVRRSVRGATPLLP